jgi:hypothetical protein
LPTFLSCACSLRRYSYSAVSLNFLISAIAMLAFLLVGGVVQQLWMVEEKTPSGKIELDLPLLIGEWVTQARGCEPCW